MTNDQLAQKLESHGLKGLGNIYWNLTAAELYEQSVRRNEAQVSEHGALIANTGKHTGRSAQDKFVVEEASSKDDIWWGKMNKPTSEGNFDKLHTKIASSLENKDVFVQDLYCGADPETQIKVRVVTEFAWHNLFARNMFIRPAHPSEMHEEPDFTVIDSPSCLANPEEDGTRSETFIVLNFAAKTVLIGGTSYAGEIKKSIFTVMNYLLPKQGVMPMHSSSNMGDNGSTAVFFGLSGTGKTTLSADASRALIGDDEHGWNDRGVFNFEGGCYAKVIRLSAEAEPEIFQTTRTFGTILENVVYDETTRVIDLDDNSLTENTRGSYPVEQIPNAQLDGQGGHPENIIFLTCDAFGVLPPVSKLTTEQAMYQFINGYTAKVAGTEKGVTEPTPNFSPCYGGPFLPIHPKKYADMLGALIEKHNVNVWLVNTGWVGGAYGTGNRISIKHTRGIVNAILGGSLATAETEVVDHFNLSVPTTCANVPSDVLNPREIWEDKEAYDAQATKLASLFDENYQQYA